MSKILLIYEDYSELTQIEAALKKVGFDVIGLTNEFLLSEQIISFNPDIVIAYGHGSKVSSLGVGRRLKEATRWSGKSVLIFKPQSKPQPNDLMKLRADLFLESPVNSKLIVQVISKLLGFSEVDTNEKIERLSAFETQQKAGQAQDSGRGGSLSVASSKEDSIYVGGGGAEDEVKRGLFSFREKDAKSLYSPGDSDSNPNSHSNETGATNTKSLFDVDLDSLENEVLGKKPSDKKEIISKESAPLKKIKSSDDVLDLPPAEIQAIANKGIEGTGVLGVSDAESQKTQNHSKEIGNKDDNYSESSNVKLLSTIRGELAENEEQSEQRNLIYQSYLVNSKLAPSSTITRVAAKARVKEFNKGIDIEKMSDQDELRREFVQAMFKKK